MEIIDLPSNHLQALISLPKVELHLHLEGMVSANLIYQTAQRRAMPLPKSVAGPEDLIPYISSPPFSTSLTEWLQVFDFFMPFLKGDSVAIRQLTLEACDYLVANNILYAELRFCPHLFEDENMSAAEALSIICSTMAECSQYYNIHVRFLLCAIRDKPEWTHEIVDLAYQYRNMGVVGIDLAGDEQYSCAPHAAEFARAKSLGLRITVHAGEAGPAEEILAAINDLYAERIGHGYKCIQSRHVYNHIKQSGIHLECCLTSSLQTGAVPAPLSQHPVVKFAQDHVSFSLSTDDPAVCSTTLDQEYARAFGEAHLTFEMITRSIQNAIHAAFLPDSERIPLQNQIAERIHEATVRLIGK